MPLKILQFIFTLKLDRNVHNSFVSNNPKLGKPKYLSMDEWLNKLLIYL